MTTSDAIRAVAMSSMMAAADAHRQRRAVVETCIHLAELIRDHYRTGFVEAVSADTIRSLLPAAVKVNVEGSR